MDIRGGATDVEDQAIAQDLGEELGAAQHGARGGQDAPLGQLREACHARRVDDVTAEDIVDEVPQGLDVEHVHLGKDIVRQQQFHASQRNR